MEPSTNGETQQLSWLQQQHKSSRQSSEQIPGPFASLPFSSSSDVFPDATLMSEWSYLATSSGPPLTTSLEDVALIRQIFSNSTSATVSSSKEWQCLSNNVNINVGAIKAEDNCATGMACLQSLDSDPGFVERAAKFSSFGGKFAQSDVSFQQTVPDSLKGVISRTASCPPTVGKDGSIPRTLLPVPEEASVVISDKSSAGNAKLCSDSITRKRKTDRSNAQNQKVSSDSEESKQKRSRGTENEDTKVKSEEAGNNSKGHSAQSTPEVAKENAKPLEPPKDYIHVRARRGQATDSHSLAERVRREKISERMRYLQDLVPGCNKVTGKAVMLDEIINYVKSLQRQVEFLSMKLAAVNPRLDFNIDHLIPKEMMAKPSGAIPTELSSYIQFQHNQQQLASIQPGGCCVSDIPTVATSAQTTSLHVTDSSAEIFMDLDFQGHGHPAWEGDMQNAFNLSMMQSRQPQPQNQYSQLLPGHIDVNQAKMEM